MVAMKAMLATMLSEHYLATKVVNA